ncbi:hypothetical protein Tco_0064182 [Tanacetum coccineum]
MKHDTLELSESLYLVGRVIESRVMASTCHPGNSYARRQVEFRRISLTGFYSRTSRSHYRSVSKQTTWSPFDIHSDVLQLKFEAFNVPSAELVEVTSASPVTLIIFWLTIDSKMKIFDSLDYKASGKTNRSAIAKVENIIASARIFIGGVKMERVCDVDPLVGILGGYTPKSMFIIGDFNSTLNVSDHVFNAWKIILLHLNLPLGKSDTSCRDSSLVNLKSLYEEVSPYHITIPSHRLK